METWWPDLPADENKVPEKKHLQGLFVRGQARRRRKGLAKAKAKCKAAAKSKAAGVKKTKGKTRLKKAKPSVPVPAIAGNFLRHGVGIRLVKEQMEKAKALDQSKFPHNLVFHVDHDTCRMKFPECHGRRWSDIQGAAHKFFKFEFLGLIGFLCRPVFVFSCVAMCSQLFPCVAMLPCVAYVWYFLKLF